jgi:hypothetical protein
MAVHDYHDALPGFNPAQILHDGCAECEQRGRDLSFGQLDGRNFERAWKRAVQWNAEGLPDISDAEAPMLRVLWDIILQLEHRGVRRADHTPPGKSYAEQYAEVFGKEAT